MGTKLLAILICHFRFLPGSQSNTVDGGRSKHGEGKQTLNVLHMGGEKGFLGLPGGIAKQTNMFRVFHTTSHLGWVVWWGERFLFAGVVAFSRDV